MQARYANPVFGEMPHIHPDFPDFGMGRLPAIDFRDRKFAVKHTDEHALTAKLNRTWRAGAVLDQGSTPQCVAYSCEGFLTAGPVVNKPYKEPADLYKLAQENDEWPGEDYDGSSVRGGFKAMTALGFIKEYNWAATYEEVAHHVMAVGPVVFGTNWYDSMFDPDKKGYLNIAPGANIAGGHAYLIIGVNDAFKNPDGSVGRLRMVNSWGRGWGNNGRAWMSSAVADRLLSEYGEGCTAMELKFKEQDGPADGEEEYNRQAANRKAHPVRLPQRRKAA
jgi:hypothetical protein